MGDYYGEGIPALSDIYEESENEMDDSVDILDDMDNDDNEE